MGRKSRVLLFVLLFKCVREEYSDGRFLEVIYWGKVLEGNVLIIYG